MALPLIVSPALSNAQDSLVSQDNTHSPLPFSVDMSTSVHSKYRVSGGGVLSDDPAIQSYLGLTFKDNLVAGDSITPYIWGSLNANSGKFTEADYGVNYSLPLFDIFGGNLSGSLETVLWDYPDGTLGSYDLAMIGRLNWAHDKLPNLNLKATQLFTSGSGRSFTLSASKGFDVLTLRNGLNLSLTPNASVSYHDDLYGYTGPGAFQYGAGLNLNFDKFNFEVYAKQQEPLDPRFDSGLVFGGSAGISF